MKPPAEPTSPERRTPAGCELWGATPALEAFVGDGGLQELDLPDDARVAVTACGRGHDLRLFARLGYAVTGLETDRALAEEARRLLELNRVHAEVLCRDLLGLLPEFAGAFDLVYEHLGLCTVRPHLRRAYARTLAGLLAPGGRLLVLAFPTDPKGAADHGAPYVVREHDVVAGLAPWLELERSFAPVGSPSARAGGEQWFLWRKPLRMGSLDDAAKA